MWGTPPHELSIGYVITLKEMEPPQSMHPPPLVN
jgi:hypothetical protein